MEKQWEELTPEQKRRKRFADWLKPGIKFDSPAAEKAYNTRVKRLADTLLMCTGTPKAVKEYCRKLIEICGKDGGYILTGGASASEVKADNLRAMMAAAKEYGKY